MQVGIYVPHWRRGWTWLSFAASTLTIATASNSKIYDISRPSAVIQILHNAYFPEGLLLNLARIYN